MTEEPECTRPVHEGFEAIFNAAGKQMINFQVPGIHNLE